MLPAAGAESSQLPSSLCGTGRCQLPSCAGLSSLSSLFSGPRHYDLGLRPCAAVSATPRMRCQTLTLEVEFPGNRHVLPLPWAVLKE